MVVTSFSVLFHREFFHLIKKRIKQKKRLLGDSVERAILDFRSGQDLGVGELKPHVRLCADGMESVWVTLSFPSLCPSCDLCLSLLKKAP